MNIKSASFVKSIFGTNEILYDGKFQVAFMGRSNAGKSSLINSLVLKNSLARSSSSPGKTISMDFFLINKDFYFVDFPGYGYAKHSQKEREKLAKMVLWYLMFSEVKNRLVVIVADAKVGLTDFDKDIIKTLREQKINFLVVANKIDSFSKNERERKISELREKNSDLELITYSSKEKIGRKTLLEKIFSYFL